MTNSLAAATALSREPEAGSTLNVLGVTHIYKVTGAETGGSLSFWEAIIPPGAGAPLHTHSREDEAFYVLSGEILIEREGEAAPLTVGPGDFFFGARGRYHAFRNVGDETARVLMLSTPSCGLDQMFADLETATRGGMPDPPRLVAIASKYGVTIKPPSA
ncbi:cupin domain-containing protein [Bradyrhizobium sp. ISRA443]|uniref:cupin domain-containing protein n=1 Tax=unclassified Bradyrhizobium TaxID=2631580 RepID=UPI00247A0DDC|nr:MULTISPECIES: cupin domain-containing protein [unclassified Bradyrhizobium]WGR92249.1 cupin domain-containing protein [Bradyrhizobium sp. ISRA435]WGR96554.1 cupin domain-containing protein [Bradyrhizobium sp. ISRA436]WGS03441.1 cupin domain-containing protein [Bradyrhizobium sp. ISRA437]WGS10325.1 cupin domain-containing protein [Bradyrhizobium sp. ISRA443]